MCFTPVLLGGIFRSTDAPQGASGSASDAMSPAKRRLFAMDLVRQFARRSLPFAWNPAHPIRSVDAMRLLASQDDDSARAALAHRLFAAYWVEGRDVSSSATLCELAAVPPAELASLCALGRDRLQANTDALVARGAFGVPCFTIGASEHFIYGSDRLHFVARALGDANACLPRYVSPALGRDGRPARPRRSPLLEVFVDLASPWAYIGAQVVQAVAEETGARVIFVPILLGALFKQLGTPNVPLATLTDAKRDWVLADQRAWCAWWNVPFRFASKFPIRSVAALRCCVVQPEAVQPLFRAAWSADRDISDEAVIRAVLAEAGLDADAILSASASETAKNLLKANTARAAENGLFGVPTFVVDGDFDRAIFGQDRLDTLADVLCAAAHSASPAVSRARL